MDLFIVLFSSLLSGLIGVGVSTWYHKRLEKRMYKLLLLERFIGNRYDITGDKFSEALNSVFVVFHDSKPVIWALKEFYENALDPTRTGKVSNQKLLDLFKAMCKDLNIDPQPLTDNFFMEPFNLKS